MDGNPGIRTLPNGDVDIDLSPEEVDEVVTQGGDPEPEASVDPANLVHPEELGGE